MFTFSEPRTEALIHVLREHPAGADLIDIAVAMDPNLAQRTLQRWLAKLVAAGQIKRRGRARRTRYFAGDGRFALPVKKRVPKPVESDPVPAPKPAPELPPEPDDYASELPPEFRPLFDRIAPRIIKSCLLDDVAISELAGSALREFGDEDTMNEFVEAAMAEFDALERDRTLAKYNLRPAHWDAWRPQWCDLRGLAE